MTEKTDVVIIGAGPIGLFSVFECGMLKLNTCVIDALGFIGGQCTALYPEKPIYDIPAHTKIKAQELIEQLAKQAAPFNPTYHLNQQVISVKKQNSGIFYITTSKGIVIEAKAIIIASGAGAFGPNRPLIEGLAEYEKSGAVSYLVGKNEDFRDKRVVIAGGGDSAVDWAISLAEIAKTVSVVHRRHKFRAAPESSEKLQKLSENGKIELVIPYQLDGLEGVDGKLESVLVKDFENNIRKLDADVLLPFYGLSMDLGPISEWGLSIDKKHVSVNPATCSTNIDGIFAVGDICTYEGKLKLILCGFSESAMAANAVYKIVHPDKALHFEYSTTKGVL